MIITSDKNWDNWVYWQKKRNQRGKNVKDIVNGGFVRVDWVNKMT